MAVTADGVDTGRSRSSLHQSVVWAGPWWVAPPPPYFACYIYWLGKHRGAYKVNQAHTMGCYHFYVLLILSMIKFIGSSMNKLPKTNYKELLSSGVNQDDCMVWEFTVFACFYAG